MITGTSTTRQRQAGRQLAYHAVIDILIYGSNSGDHSMVRQIDLSDDSDTRCLYTHLLRIAGRCAIWVSLTVRYRCFSLAHQSAYGSGQKLNINVGTTWDTISSQWFKRL